MTTKLTITIHKNPNQYLLTFQSPPTFTNDRPAEGTRHSVLVASLHQLVRAVEAAAHDDFATYLAKHHKKTNDITLDTRTLDDCIASFLARGGIIERVVLRTPATKPRLEALPTTAATTAAKPNITLDDLFNLSPDFLTAPAAMSKARRQAEKAWSTLSTEATTA